MVWDGDAKAVQQCLTDIFTSVYTTCDIPENAIFGPCVLSHTSLYDSIAFIALKSTDKRTAPYIFRVRGSNETREVHHSSLLLFYYELHHVRNVTVTKYNLQVIYLIIFVNKYIIYIYLE